MPTKITITTEVTDGNIDRDAIRCDVFHQLERELDDCESYNERVSQAVSGVFDSSAPGTRFLLNHLLSKTIEALDVQPEQYSKWEARVLDYVRSNSKGEDGLFMMGKGTKNGGVARKVKPAQKSETVNMPSEVPSSTEMVAAAE